MSIMHSFWTKRVLAMRFGYAVCLLSAAVVSAMLLGNVPQAAAEAGLLLPDTATVFQGDETLDEPRLQMDRGTNTRFSMTEFDSLEDWEPYAVDLRRRIQVACAVWPPPDRTPLNPQVFDTVEREGYKVSKVYFEAYPGFLVTGNLYEPLEPGPFPAAACPHGHWPNGRLEDGERGSVPARGITLARMGIVAFCYDMVGYNDSMQFSKEWAHSYDKVPEAVRRQQQLWGFHPFALQLWSSMRVLDFLESLPNVDPRALACTGASGGGTQTFALTAVDPRVKVAAPVNMISHKMQGGCVCENAPLIRFNASNMEIAALAAPRPMMMVSASGDWTSETPDVEFPAVRSIYKLYDAADQVENAHFDAGHNYNQDSREAVYRFFGTHLLKQPEKYQNFTEPEYELEDVEQLRVFPDGNLPGIAKSQEELVTEITAQTQERIRKEIRRSVENSGRVDTPLQEAFAKVFGAELIPPGDIEAKTVRTSSTKEYEIEHLVLTAPSSKGKIPALFYKKAGTKPSKMAVVVHGQGKAAFIEPLSGEPNSFLVDLLKKDVGVLAIDPYLIGEHRERTSHIERKDAGFPDTFLPTDTAHRVRDIAVALDYAQQLASGNDPAEGEVAAMAGLGEAGVWCLFAHALRPWAREVVVDFNGFNPSLDSDWVQRHYVPSIRSVGGIYMAANMVPQSLLYFFNIEGPVDLGLLNAARRATGQKDVIVSDLELEGMMDRSRFTAIQ